VAVLSAPASAVRMLSVGMLLTGVSVSIAILYLGRAFWITLVSSVILALLLEPFVVAVMRLRIPRGGAAFIVCTISLLTLYLLSFAVFTQLSNLTDDLPYLSDRVNRIVDAAAERVQSVEQRLYRLVVPKRFQDQPPKIEPPKQDPTPRRRRRNEPPPPAPEPEPPPIQEVRIRQEQGSILNAAYAYITSLYQVLLMVSFVPFLVYFMLSWHDHLRKRFLSIFQGQDRATAGRTWQSIASMARAYVLGNFILGLILSVATAGCLWAWGVPYWLMAGFVSGFLSLIPYVGLPLALLPALGVTVLTYDTITPYLIISAQVAFLHLMGLNLLYPAVVGARLHLNPLAVTIALMFWGTLWGGIGLVLAIPITAGAKAIFDSIEGLQPYGRLLGD
jgi:predicted PurR-regulated permease PerM